MRARAAILLAIGLLQMGGDLLGLPALKAIGAATGLSPAPKVFSSVRGLETYSTRYIVEWRDRTGAAHALELTPEVYDHLRGPYNRRNAYGAALAFGPVLLMDPHTQPMFRAVSEYALCGRAPLLRELGVDVATIAGAVHVRLIPQPGTDPSLPRELATECS